MLIDQLQQSGDLVELTGSDEYARYFNHLNRVFTILMRWYDELIEGGIEEERLTDDFLARFLYTIQQFRLKYLFNQSHTLMLDLNESGLPNSMAIMELEVDLRQKEEKLRIFPPEGIIKAQMLDDMLIKKEEPTEGLWAMAERQYFSSLDPTKLVLGFVPGELILRATEGNLRKYLFSWGCYDFKTNMLYVYLMTFDQDVDEEPLERKGLAYHHFLEVIKVLGSRAGTVGVVAYEIDRILKAIHPKTLKRVRIGPIYCPAFSRGQESLPLLRFLKEFGKPDDFALRLTSEVVFSVRQKTQQRGLLDFGRTKRVREVFLIPENDLACFEQKASAVYENLFLPHCVMQQARTDPDFIAAYGAMRIITFDKEGALYEVQSPSDSAQRSGG